MHDGQAMHLQIGDRPITLSTMPGRSAYAQALPSPVPGKTEMRGEERRRLPLSSGAVALHAADAVRPDDR
jgi:hypothetical protein